MKTTTMMRVAALVGVLGGATAAFGQQQSTLALRPTVAFGFQGGEVDLGEEVSEKEAASALTLNLGYSFF